MNTKLKKCFSGRLLPIVLLAVGLLAQFGCSILPERDDRPVDLSRIYVFEITPAPSLQLPTGHGDALIQLSQDLRQQLARENKLQSDPRYHSLSFYGAILSYRDGVIDVQGELYDDEQFLVYSRVKRRLDINENWEVALNLIAEQLLDELMTKLLQLPPPMPVPAPAPVPGPIIIDQTCWDCWRHDGDNTHGYPSKSEPRKPKPHWLPGAILDVAPRAEILHQEHPHRIIEREERSSGTSTDSSTDSSTSSGDETTWLGGGGSTSSSSESTSTSMSSRHHRDHTSEHAPASRPASQEHHSSGNGSSSRGGYSSGSHDGERSSSSSSSNSGSGRHNRAGSSAPGNRHHAE